MAQCRNASSESAEDHQKHDETTFQRPNPEIPNKTSLMMRQAGVEYFVGLLPTPKLLKEQEILFTKAEWVEHTQSRFSSY